MFIVIHSGFCWSQWSPHPSDLEKSGVGGSQIAATHVAHALVDLGHTVVLFGDFYDSSLARCSDDAKPLAQGQLQGRLFCKPLTDYVRFIGDESRPIIDLLVVSRYCNLLYFGTGVRNVCLWCHDVVPSGVAELEKVCSGMKTKPRLTVLALSDWHRDRLKSLFSSQVASIAVSVLKTSNGIEKGSFDKDPWRSIVPNRFIYSSACYRGLDVVFKCWPAIRVQFPDAELHVFSDFESPLVQQKLQPLADKLIQTANSLHGVFLHGFVGQAMLRKHLYAADVWFYPTDFEETYCITALECQASGTLCLCSPVAALKETVGEERGIMLPLRKQFQIDADYVDSLVQTVCDTLHNRKNTFAMRKRARQWALQQTWQRVALDWIATTINAQ